MTPNGNQFTVTGKQNSLFPPQDQSLSVKYFEKPHQPRSWDLEMLVFVEEGNWRTLRKTLGARQEITTYTTQIWHWVEINH